MPNENQPTSPPKGATPHNNADNLPIVAIIGRPNVGKSALFNRLVGRRQSIVADRPGVTRDRIYADCDWSGRRFQLVDTGGMDPQDEDILRRQVFEQARRAIDESTVLLMIVDGQNGPHPLDYDLAGLLRAIQRPVILVVNKSEAVQVEADRYQFYSLGLGDPVAVSAIHGTNTGDLLDLVIKFFPDERHEEPGEELAIALVGRPNVGKSSLVNCLLGEERSLVHHEAGTTRDTIDSVLEVDNRRIRLVDTAGLRRKSKVQDDVEFYSNLRAINALQRSHVGVLVLDATEKISAQDQRIAGEIQDSKLASVIVVNKWDLVPGKTPEARKKAQQEFVKEVSTQLDFLAFSPVIYCSAKTGYEVQDIMQAAMDSHEQWSKRVDTSTLNIVVREAVAINPPPSYKGKTLKVLYVSQQRSQPPTFVFKVNSPKLLHFSYKRYLENQLRKAFGFVGTPVVMHLQ
jgi:GTP-binding protein